ncbi:MAG: hypothetical protein Q8L26_01800 [Candidatus Omnitrophota bacterium]|nr:hypothetical protein [Candidatus Omnitrophota bacterium]
MYKRRIKLNAVLSTVFLGLLSGAILKIFKDSYQSKYKKRYFK